MASLTVLSNNVAKAITSVKVKTTKCPAVYV